MPGGRGRRRPRWSTRATRSGCGRQARWTSTTSCCWWCGCWPRRRRCSPGTGGSGATCWSTSTRTPTARSTGSSACSPRSIATSASSATPTSRSTGGGARTSATSSTSRTTFRAPRSCGWSRTTARPSASWPWRPESSPTTSRARTRRCGRRIRQGSRRASTARGTSTRRPRSSPSRILGLRGEGVASGRGRGLLPYERAVPRARGRAAARPASPTSSWAACASTSGARSRTPWPTCGSR